VPPRLQRASSTRHHHVGDREVDAQPVGERGRRHPDAPAEGTDVGAAERLAEDADGSARRVAPQRGDAQQAGLAGTVGTEDHPPVGGGDGPVDVGEQGAAVDAQTHAEELDGWRGVRRGHRGKVPPARSGPERRPEVHDRRAGGGRP
jgi:hypothetical protein